MDEQQTDRVEVNYFRSCMLWINRFQDSIKIINLTVRLKLKKQTKREIENRVDGKWWNASDGKCIIEYSGRRVFFSDFPKTFDDFLIVSAQLVHFSDWLKIVIILWRKFEICHF